MHIFPTVRAGLRRVQIPHTNQKRRGKVPQAHVCIRNHSWTFLMRCLKSAPDIWPVTMFGLFASRERRCRPARTKWAHESQVLISVRATVSISDTQDVSNYVRTFAPKVSLIVFFFEGVCVGCPCHASCCGRPCLLWREAHRCAAVSTCRVHVGTGESITQARRPCADLPQLIITIVYLDTMGFDEAGGTCVRGTGRGQTRLNQCAFPDTLSRHSTR